MSSETDNPSWLYTTDANGHRLLRGLTKDETVEHDSYWKRRLNSQPTSCTEDDRWLQLRKKHEAARQAVLNAERELRERPTLN